MKMNELKSFTASRGPSSAETVPLIQSYFICEVLCRARRQGRQSGCLALYRQHAGLLGKGCYSSSVSTCGAEWGEDPA